MRPLFRIIAALRFRGPRLAVLAICALWVSSIPACRTSGENSMAELAANHDALEPPITEADVDMPADFSAAVVRIKEYGTRVFAAIATGTPHDAHRPLDEMDIVIGKLMPIVRSSGVSREEWDEVNSARREIRAQFDLIHAALDRGEQPDMAATRPAIDTAIKRLEDVAAKAGSRDRDPSRQKPASEEALP
jgi:hypothetical protein